VTAVTEPATLVTRGVLAMTVQNFLDERVCSEEINGCRRHVVHHPSINEFEVRSYCRDPRPYGTPPFQHSHAGKRPGTAIKYVMLNS
jgi:hypothetical protein